MWQDTKRIFLDSAESLLRATARLLPSVLAMLLFFALSLAVGLGAKDFVARSLQRRFPDAGAPDGTEQEDEHGQIHHT